MVTIKDVAKRAGVSVGAMFSVSERMKPNGIGRRGFMGGLVAAQMAAAQEKPTAAQVKWRLVVGCDHAGFPLKASVIQTLKSWGHAVKDIGTYSAEPVDFPDVAQELCSEITSGRCDRGIMVCGTGVGATIAVNKISGMRAALCHDTFCAHQCVEHDNVNVLCLGAWIIGPRLAEEVLHAYVMASFASEDPDFKRRVQKLEEMDKK